MSVATIIHCGSIISAFQHYSTIFFVPPSGLLLKTCNQSSNCIRRPFHIESLRLNVHENNNFQNMPRGVKKEHLPTKICVTCERPFTWRKKWERVWDDVTTCSKSCNRKRRMGRQILNSGGDPEPFFEQSLSPSVVNSLDSEIVNEQKTEDDADCSMGSMGSNVLEELEALNLECDLNPDFDELDGISLQDEEDPVERQKAERKAAKKKKKQERRAQREGRGDPTCGQKQCDMCTKSVDLLIRCTYDETQEWNMVCGKCWHKASGGVVDGDSMHPHYKYGGLWKNRRAQK